MTKNSQKGRPRETSIVSNEIGRPLLTEEGTPTFPLGQQCLCFRQVDQRLDVLDVNSRFMPIEGGVSKTTASGACEDSLIELELVLTLILVRG